ELRDRLKLLDRELAHLAIDHLLETLRSRYSILPEVVAYLQAVQQDVLDNLDNFRAPAAEAQATTVTIPLPPAQANALRFRRYQINVLVERGDHTGAPVIYEDFPTYQNLVGQVEQMVAQMGTILVDFLLIKPGALHRANGGYLVLEVP